MFFEGYMYKPNQVEFKREKQTDSERERQRETDIQTERDNKC